jgi:hypothetical protein
MKEEDQASAGVARHTLLDEILSQQKQPLSEVISRVTYVAKFVDQATVQSATRAFGTNVPSILLPWHVDVGTVYDRKHQCREA